jgi:flagellar biogenesis protein FliO
MKNLKPETNAPKKPDFELFWMIGGILLFIAFILTGVWIGFTPYL